MPIPSLIIKDPSRVFYRAGIEGNALRFCTDVGTPDVADRYWYLAYNNVGGVLICGAWPASANANTQVARSTDNGATWAGVPTGQPNTMNLQSRSLWVGDKFIVGDTKDGGATGIILTSPDGLVYTQRAATNPFYCIAYAWDGANAVVAGSSDGLNNGGNVYVSGDKGLTWAGPVATALVRDIEALAYSPDLALWAAVGGADGAAYIATSPTPGVGGSWNSHAIPALANNRILYVMWSPLVKKFLACGNCPIGGPGVPMILYSNDGITWNRANVSLPVNFVNGNLFSIREINGALWCVGNASINGVVSGATFVSFDGITWSEIIGFGRSLGTVQDIQKVANNRVVVSTHPIVGDASKFAYTAMLQ